MPGDRPLVAHLQTGESSQAVTTPLGLSGKRYAGKMSSVNPLSLTFIKVMIQFGCVKDDRCSAFEGEKVNWWVGVVALRTFVTFCSAAHSCYFR